jgi:hypothetical protein
MEHIKQNVQVLADYIRRSDFNDTTALDIFTAFYVILGKKFFDSAITDDKHFAFLISCLRNVSDTESRRHWMDTMFRIYEKLSLVDVNDANWLLLQANLIYLGGGC